MARYGIALLLLTFSAQGQIADIAVCKEGQCVMPEKTYRELKSFVTKLIEADAKNEHSFAQEQHRADSCESFLKGNKT